MTSKAIRDAFRLPLYAYSLIGSWAFGGNDCALGLPPLPDIAQPRNGAEQVRSAAGTPAEPGGPLRIRLGARLFTDSSLSRDGTVSCAVCHDARRAFTDGKPRSQGVRRQFGTRNAPSLINVGYAPVLAWDGRREHLEDQVLDPFLHPREMGLSDTGELLARLRARSEYRTLFRQAFPGSAEGLTEDQLRAALAAYLRTLTGGGSPFDRYYYGHETSALSVEARLGLELFTGRAGCSDCHRIDTPGALFTDYGFHRIGIGMSEIMPSVVELTRRAAAADRNHLDRLILADPAIAALGRYVVTLKPSDIGRFRTPSLRNVALTAPYMHDGSVATLPAAIEAELYYRGLETGKPIALTPREKQALVRFLESLSGCVPSASGRSTH